ncbi:MAG: hypothetical protein KGV56_03295 [Gammaproteobacteria bacterium]|nr:hypothetical protein [Gammaproteobacteria bacterium]
MTDKELKPHFMYCKKGEYVDELSLRIDALVADMFHISGEFACTGTPTKPDIHLLPTIYRLFHEAENIKALFHSFLEQEKHIEKRNNAEKDILKKYEGIHE